MNQVKGYIYRGDGKLTIMDVHISKIGQYTNKGNYYIAPSKEDLITHFEDSYGYHISNAKSNDEKEKYQKQLEIIINDIENGEVVYENIT